MSTPGDSHPYMPKLAPHVKFSALVSILIQAIPTDHFPIKEKQPFTLIAQLLQFSQNSLGSSSSSPLSLHHSLFDAVAVVSHLFPLTFSWLETLSRVGFDKKEIRSLLGKTLSNSLSFLSDLRVCLVV
jgi:hypothetical protein